MNTPLTPVPFRAPGSDGSGRHGYPPAPEPLPVPVMDNHTHLDFPNSDVTVDVAAAADPRFEFTVDIPGRVAVELHDLHVTVVTNEVRP